MASSRSIQGYEKSAEWLLVYGTELKHAALHNLVSGVAAGLDQLIRTRGRAHGNLSPATILISGPRRLSRAGVALADPPGDAPASEAGDLYALGLLIFRLVTHEQFDKIFNYPIDPKRFTGLRRHVDAWCSLCGRLLDPDASQRLTRLSDLVAALEEMKPRLPRPPRWLIIAFVMGLAGYFIVQAVVGWRNSEDRWFKEFAELVARKDTREKWEGNPTLKAIIDECKEGSKKQPGSDINKKSIISRLDQEVTKLITLSVPPDPRLRRLVVATIERTRKEGIVQPAQITKVLDLKSKIPDIEQDLKSFDNVLGGELSTLKDRVDFGADEESFRENLSKAQTSILAAMETVGDDSGIVTGIIESKHRTDLLIASATLVEDFTRVCANVVKWQTDVNEKQMAFEKAANSLGITVTVTAPATQPAEGFEKACRALADELSKATTSLKQVKVARDQARKLLPAELANVEPKELWGSVQEVAQVADAAAKVEKWWQDLTTILEAAQTAFNSVRAGTNIPEKPGIDPDGKLKSDMKPGELAAAVQGLRDRLAKLSKKRIEINDQIEKVLLARPGVDLAGLPGFMADELLGANDLGSLETKLSTVGTAIGDIHSYVVGDRKLEVDWVVFAERKLPTTQPATSPSERYQRWTTLADECRILKPDEKAAFTAMLTDWPGDRFDQAAGLIKKAETGNVVSESTIKAWEERNKKLRLSFYQIEKRSPCQVTLKERPGELTTLEANIKQLVNSINEAIAAANGTERIAKLANKEFKTRTIKEKWDEYVKSLSSQDAASINTAEEAGKNLTDLETWASEVPATNDWLKEFQNLAKATRGEAAQSLLPGDWTKMAIWTGGFQDKFNSARAAYENRRVTLAALSDDWKFIRQKLEAQYVTADEHKQVIEKAQSITNDSKAKLALSGNPVWQQVELLLTVAGETDRKTLAGIYQQLAANLPVKLAVLRQLALLSKDSFQNSEEFDLAGQLLKQLAGEARGKVLDEVKRLWTARASKIDARSDLESWKSAIACKKKFLLDDNDPWPLNDTRVSADLRHNVLLYALKDAWQNALKDPSDDSLKANVGRLMAPLGNGLPADSSLSTLKNALENALKNDGLATRPATAPASQPTDAGPASDHAKVKWTLQKNEQDGALKFTWSLPQNKDKPHTLFFRYVKTPDGQGAYLCTTEMSVGLFADIDTASRALPEVKQGELQGWLSEGIGVRTWVLDTQKAPASIRESSKGWLPGQLRESDYYAPDLLVAGGKFPGGGPPEREHPIQYLPPKAAVRLAGFLDCRLPTVEEWQAATEQMPKGVKCNLRDLKWQKQREHVQKLPQLKNWENAPDPSLHSYSSNDKDSNDIWHQDKNGKLSDKKADPPHNDGFLWFDKVCPDGGKATDFQHLIGNVAEFVTDKPLPLGEGVKLLIIGASALSAPDPKDLPSGVEEIKGHPCKVYDAFSDVGFRLAFSASAAPAKSPLRKLIDDSQYVLAK